MRVKEPYAIEEEVTIANNRVTNSRYVYDKNGSCRTLVSRVTRPIEPVITTKKQTVITVGTIALMVAAHYALLLIWFLTSYKKGL